MGRKTAWPQTTDRSMMPARLTLAALAGTLALATAHADSGLYLRAEVGASLAGELMLGSRDSDRASYCDEFVNPRYAAIEGCVSPDRGIGAVDAWTSNFDPGAGLLGAVAFGKQIGSIWRIELEYLDRRVRLDQTAAIISPSGRPYADLFGAELPNAEEHVRDVSAHALFANLLVDLPGAGRLTPWLGVGAGAASSEIDHGALWRRSGDPALMNSVESAIALGLPRDAAAQLRANLAGTESITRDRLRDRSSAYQLLAGARYPLRENLLLGLTARWVEVGDWQDGGSYRQLRSHASNLRLDLSEPVEYRVQTRDLGFYAVTLSLTLEL